MLIYLNSKVKMKNIKGLTILLITLTLGSCFDPPEFPVVPKIDFVDIKFKEGTNTNRTDSLMLWLDFEDGDGDLGLDPADPFYNSYPFNNLKFFQTAPGGNLTEINTTVFSVEHINRQNQRVNEPFQILQISDPASGTLVFPRTRKQSGYSNLPVYRDCGPYEFIRGNFAIEARNAAVLGEGASVDTLFVRSGNNNIATHYVIRDTLLFEVNPRHYNIEVDFLVKDPNHPDADETGFYRFDWRAEFCQQDLDGRFPILTDQDGPLEGTLRYAMTTIGFKRIFTIKTLKLRIKIRDQGGNESNEIETQEFTLDSIRI